MKELYIFINFDTYRYILSIYEHVLKETLCLPFASGVNPALLTLCDLLGVCTHSCREEISWCCLIEPSEVFMTPCDPTQLT